MTEAERRLWYLLRAHRFQGLKFKRQVPIGPYVVDFASMRARVIVEVDGEQHAENLKDELVIGS
jgi:very-short-patch-repair endonuclease